MPQPRVKIIVRPQVAGGLTTFRNMVLTQLQQYPNWKSKVDVLDVDEIGQARIIELEFASIASAQAFRSWVASNLATIRAQVRGIMKGYLCSHDDPIVTPCNGPNAQYQEVQL